MIADFKFWCRRYNTLWLWHSPVHSSSGEKEAMTGLQQWLLLMAEQGGSLGFRAGWVPGVTFSSLTFNLHEATCPNGVSSTQGNSSNFHFTHFYILAGDFFGTPLSEGISQLPSAFDENKTFDGDSILSSHICLWLSYFVGYFTCELYCNRWCFPLLFF